MENAGFEYQMILTNLIHRENKNDNNFYQSKHYLNRKTQKNQTDFYAASYGVQILAKLNLKCIELRLSGNAVKFCFCDNNMHLML